MAGNKGKPKGDSGGSLRGVAGGKEVGEKGKIQWVAAKGQRNLLLISYVTNW